MNNQNVRVRFAPSPTGHLHIGGARTALFNWLFARHHGGQFILRIEDTDRERSKSEYVDGILEGLLWLGIDWDEGPGKDGNFGPYFQSARTDFYEAAKKKLLKENKLYYCFCSPEELDKMRKEQAAVKEQIKYDGRCRHLSSTEVSRKLSKGEKAVLRLRRSEGENVSWKDEVKGEMSFSADLLDDFVVFRSDGLPTYNFAVVVDDSTMKITHVIRGEDHISNTPKQIMLYRALGEPIPVFAHIPLILGPDKTRLSKRHGATSVIEYRSAGYSSEALRNYLALQGWSAGPGHEILTIDEMISKFSLSNVSSHGSIFNQDKLTWMNAEYIKRMSNEALFNALKPFLTQVPGYPDEYSEQELIKMVSLYKERIKIFSEIISQIEWFFCVPQYYDENGLEKIKKNKDYGTLSQELVILLETIDPFIEVVIEEKIRAFAADKGKKASEVIQLLRVALSGRTATPGLFEIMSVLGQTRCIQRMKKFIDKNVVLA